MTDALRLLCVLAHPDDESLAVGGVLARYAAEGVATYLVTATRGERGWQGPADEDPGPEALAAIREAELRAAARVLGLRGVRLLDYPDGALGQVDLDEAVAAVARHVRQIRPQVVISFGPEGATGHPDHVAIAQITAAALVCAADPAYQRARDWPAHRVSKLYSIAESRERVAVYDAIFGDTAMTVDGVRRAWPGWDSWAISACVGAEAHWRRVWEAIACHRSQLPGYAVLAEQPEAVHRLLWGRQEFFRVFSAVPLPPGREEDLFAGLR